jgi:hypothetical protein
VSPIYLCNFLAQNGAFFSENFKSNFAAAQNERPVTELEMACQYFPLSPFTTFTPGFRHSGDIASKGGAKWAQRLPNNNKRRSN